MSMNNAIEVADISKRFGKDIVLDHISITFESGKIHGIVGRNGSGKTVLMKCILGFLRPTAGQITVFDKRVGRDCDFAPNCLTMPVLETLAFTGQHPAAAAAKFATE